MLYSLLCKKEINRLPSCCAIFSFMQAVDRMELVLRDLTLRTCRTQGHKYPGGEINSCCASIKRYDDAGHVRSRYSITYARTTKE